MKNKFKIIAIVMLLFLTSCGKGSSSIMKKEQDVVNVLANSSFGSMYDTSSFQPFIEEFKKVSGLTLNIIKPTEYYQQMPILFTVGEIPDLFELEGSHYITYAENNVLWDMTEAWEKSNIKKSGYVDETFIEASKINGRLYGFPINRGNGGVTYIRKDWLDNLGLDIPKNYEEFLKVLKAFREDDPDGNGKKDTFGLTATGIFDNITPYDIHMREFYQDAKLDFYIKDGKYVDGMSEPEMIEALKRLNFAYKNRYIDPEIMTNNVETAIRKFTSGQAGVFNYYAGHWNVIFENDLKANNPYGEIIPIDAIENALYYERPPVMLCISSSVENPQELFDKIIEYSFDGGQGQILFNRGVEGINYYIDHNGKYVQMDNPENPLSLYPRAMYTPELSVSLVEDIIPLDERVSSSLETFRNSSVLADLPVINNGINEQIYYINDIKAFAINDMLMAKLTPEEVILQYNKEAKDMIELVLDELN